VQELTHSPLVSRKRRLDCERASIFWCASSSGIGMGSSVLSGELWKSKSRRGVGLANPVLMNALCTSEKFVVRPVKLYFLKVVAVDFLQTISVFFGDADIVFDHQLSQRM
jgi:hypothetical protein